MERCFEPVSIIAAFAYTQHNSIRSLRLFAAALIIIPAFQTSRILLFGDLGHFLRSKISRGTITAALLIKSLVYLKMTPSICSNSEVKLQSFSSVLRPDWL